MSERLLDLFTGELDDADENATQAHLERCAECARRLAELQRMAAAIQCLPQRALDSARMVRMTALAQARRTEVIERRRAHRLVTLTALLGCVLFVGTMPLLANLSGALSRQFGWHGLWGGLLVWGTWGSICWLTVLLSIPALRDQRADWKERTQ